ncbi:MAG: hypothetical protein IKU30_00170 [Clostridia bacterium]|nr:hypothetical protein [Clostridia bacterium]
MSRISKYENVVRAILLDKTATRSDDKLLYYWVLREEGFYTGITLVSYLCGDHNKYPNYDSITRIRRKLQEKHPELRPSKNDQIRRQEAEEDFIEYARE